ncbi:MAG: hypothetical protein JNM17_27380 [Archangium sp.]|nr:hypothetical protein [Archangium sp.]
MSTMREAVTTYFRENGFGDDGGYSAKWVDFKLGPIPFPLPNSEARKKAVRFHDLNHVLTGYRTDFGGECEISAWELGAGCEEYVAAWALNLGGLAGGLWFQPLKTWRAFVAGRRSRHAAYAMNYEYALGREVQDVKDQLGITTQGKAKVGDAVLFGLASIGGVLVGGLMMVALLSPISLAMWWRGRKLQAESTPA